MEELKTGGSTETTSMTSAMRQPGDPMATAVLSTDGIIVVNLPPSTEPKTLFINPAQFSKWQPPTGN